MAIKVLLSEHFYAENVNFLMLMISVSSHRHTAFVSISAESKLGFTCQAPQYLFSHSFSSPSVAQNISLCHQSSEEQSGSMNASILNLY